MYDSFHNHSNQEIVAVVMQTDSDRIVVDPHVLLENLLAFRTDGVEHKYYIDSRADNWYIVTEYSIIKLNITQQVKILPVSDIHRRKQLLPYLVSVRHLHNPPEPYSYQFVYPINDLTY